MTRKDAPFDWTPSCEQAFEELKAMLTAAPVLAYPNFEQEFILETDASGVVLGAVLAQRQGDGSVRPISFASRTLQHHEKNYGITELEGLGVVWAVKHFRPYIYGHHCVVYTDHEALKSLLNTPHPSGKLARWGLALQEMDLEIRYRPGKGNSNADALSRSPLPAGGVGQATFRVVAALQASVCAEGGDPNENSDVTFAAEQRRDPELLELIRYLETNVLPDDAKKARELVLSKSLYSLVDNVLYYVERDKSLRVVPPRNRREKLFHEAHGGIYGGHLRESKVHSELGKHYWWPGMHGDIVNWCKACLVCATRHVGRAVKPLLTPIPVSGPFDRVGVDIIRYVMSRAGNQYAVVFVDYLTKWPEVYPVPDHTIARLLVEEFIPRHGVPSELLSNRGTAFLSKLMADVYELTGIHKLNTTAYHPQTDGLVERFHRTLTNMLAKVVDQSGDNWDAKLPYVLFAYRASVQESTAESPFYLLYGRDPKLPTDAMLSPPVRRSEVDLDDFKTMMTSHMAEAWELARSSVKKAQKRQKQWHDRQSKPAEFKPGDRVFIHMPGAKRGKAHKFARTFHGPYRVLELVENGILARPVDRPKEDPTRVALNRVRRCPPQIADESWPQPRGRRRKQSAVAPQQTPAPSVWRGRLRSTGRGRPVSEGGEM